MVEPFTASVPLVKAPDKEAPEPERLVNAIFAAKKFVLVEFVVVLFVAVNA